MTLFEAMRQAKGFSVQNEMKVKLLLLLAVRKGELIAARWDEFELEAMGYRVFPSASDLFDPDD